MGERVNSVGSILQAAIIASIISQQRFEPKAQPQRPNPQDMRELDRLLGAIVDGGMLRGAASDLSNDIGFDQCPGKADGKRGHGEGGNNGGEATGKYGMLDRLLMLVALLFSGGLQGANELPQSDEAPTSATGVKPKRESLRSEETKSSRSEGTDQRGGTEHPTSGAAPAEAASQTKFNTNGPRQVVTETIVVKAGQTYDGKGKTFVAGSALGDGGQGEKQDPVFKLEHGAKLVNCGVEGGDGVHCMGDAELRNVHWTDVGEDALTMKGKGNVHVIGGSADKAADKIFQLNAGGSFTLENFHAGTFGKLIRQDGGTKFPIDITLKNVTAENGKFALVQTDSPQARIRLENVDKGNTPNDVLAPDGAEVVGAQSRSYKEFKG